MGYYSQITYIECIVKPGVSKVDIERALKKASRSGSLAADVLLEDGFYIEDKTRHLYFNINDYYGKWYFMDEVAYELLPYVEFFKVNLVGEDGVMQGYMIRDGSVEELYGELLTAEELNQLQLLRNNKILSKLIREVAKYLDKEK